MTLNCDVLFLWWGLVVWGRNPTTWSIEKGDTLKWTSRTKRHAVFSACCFFWSRARPGERAPVLLSREWARIRSELPLRTVPEPMDFTKEFSTIFD